MRPLFIASFLVGSFLLTGCGASLGGAAAHDPGAAPTSMTLTEAASPRGDAHAERQSARAFERADRASREMHALRHEELRCRRCQ